MPPDPNAPYEVTQEDAPPVADDDWRQDGEDWILELTCPRCGHHADRRFGPEVVARFSEGAPAEAADSDDAVMRCNCDSPHAGRQSGRGCGAWWGFAVAGL